MPLTWRESDRFQIEEGTTDSNAKCPITSVSLSFDAHYLAVCLGVQIQVWDLLDDTIQVPKTSVEVDTITNFITWFPKSPRLATAHDEGPVYVFTIEKTGVDVDCCQRNIGVESPATYIAILDEETMAVALAALVRIQKLAVVSREKLIEENREKRWNTVGQLLPPRNGSHLVKSIHALAEGKVLVAYENNHVVVWQINSNATGSIHPQIINEFPLPGPVTDVCHKANRILCTDHVSSTYKIFEFGTGAVSLQATLHPRTRDTMKAPQRISTAIFLPPHGNAIIGGGVGQMVLFDDHGSRLQNLSFKDESEQRFTSEQANRAHVTPQSISCIYKSDIDIGLLASAINLDKQSEVIIWRTMENYKKTTPYEVKGPGPAFKFILTKRIAIIVGIMMALLAYVAMLRQIH
ncbi:hypothetical protein C8R41DRAFT_922803 [Lentinula lateritia]|uniref:WD40 repeat-like protein n=1 Tax=Lentinula lateritia TaxID=40482 RepID=A0ABQ8V8U2_9AGAR|nr:hypothetical protein C8R41DRAFT_922803 [Lentinula lateritia]